MPLNDRRQALTRFVTAGLGLIGAALTGLFGAVATPRAVAHGPRWRRAASTSDVKSEAPYAAALADRETDGWYETRHETVVYLEREGGGYLALSATCTHLGCRVSWNDQTKHFHCPCHGGVYDREGRVVSGPPPAPLARVNVRVNPQSSDLEVEL